jgi:hypothetical protein
MGVTEDGGGAQEWQELVGIEGPGAQAEAQAPR